jgi:predicted MFS family arabinose efflux permease
VLGRVSAVFLTGEAAATLIGSVAGPFLAQAAHLVAVAAAASLVTISAAAVAFRTVPRMPAVVPAESPTPIPKKRPKDTGARSPLVTGKPVPRGSN